MGLIVKAIIKGFDDDQRSSNCFDGYRYKLKTLRSIAQLAGDVIEINIIKSLLGYLTKCFAITEGVLCAF